MRRAFLPVLAVALLGAALFVPASSHARCAMRGLEVVLFSEGSPAASGGSFLVGLRTDERRQSRLRDFPEGMALQRGAETVALTLAPIAPGLARATPASAVTGDWQLTGTEATVRFARVQAPAAPRAPRVRSVTYRQLSEPSRRAPAQHSLALELSAPLSETVVALALVSRGHGSWRSVQGGARSAALYPPVGRCETLPSGFAPLRAGSQAELVAVDAHGASARTAVTVR